MGRGRVELKRIENKINRQVTFAKRRNGLLKKAYELSVLCDADVSLIIFSNRGRLYEFSSNSMQKTLERYQKCSYSIAEPVVPCKETQNSYQEYLKLKGRVEALQRSERTLLGEDLDSLNTRELEQLENQLEMSLKHIRSIKTQVMLDQLCDLKRKEQMLQESNRVLRQKLQENGPENCLQLMWGINGVDSGDPSGHQAAAHPEGLFQPLLGFDLPLQIGYTHVGVDQLSPPALTQNVSAGFVSGWV
ncbi:unnamed protein product [Spirodela intermedia]|uniref:Uncharacterized protein n=1 Tax=Spirodela intermedia TaxID=51605 RepID=A0A7I8K8R9_SPIIN|nr:unnamed protein product [Spirodela intermedia]